MNRMDLMESLNRQIASWVAFYQYADFMATMFRKHQAECSLPYQGFELADHPIAYFWSQRSAASLSDLAFISFQRSFQSCLRRWWKSRPNAGRCFESIETICRRPLSVS